MIAVADSERVDALHPSPNFGERRGGAAPSILLLHYTGVATAAKAIEWLATPASEVSCHYVIDEAGLVTQMVAEEKRAWHAGLGAWAGDTDINSSSIGIEIHNVGHENGYPGFPVRQIEAVIALARDIVARHRIVPARVLAHSDVAPARKKDPGEKFPWDMLAKAGIGHWVPAVPLDASDPGLAIGAQGAQVAEVQSMLKDYGYPIEASGVFDVAMEFVVIAFQRHFRPARVDGRIDHSTIMTLEALCAGLPSPLLLS